jgi:hypothetical protein
MELPLSNLYISKTKDRFLSAPHSATCNCPRLAVRELSSTPLEGSFYWRNCSTAREAEL